MPELPDVTVYVECLEARLVGQTLQRIRLASPFLLRSVDPPVKEAAGRRVTGVRRMGKRIVIALDGDLYLVIHLMIAGRFRWLPWERKPSQPGACARRSSSAARHTSSAAGRNPLSREAQGAPIPGKVGLAAFDFPDGTLLLTEAGTKRRASLHVVRGEAGLAEHDPGGLEVLDCTFAAFRTALKRENRTVKRALTHPRLFSGIGNAYSDEILHRAKVSPLARTGTLADEDARRLFKAARAVLKEWTDRLRREAGDRFPEKVTAFRPEMAVHGKYGKPCPVCGAPVQRIVHAENEANYCATCQTGGRLLADRALSRLLHDDWPRTLEEWEDLKTRAKA